MKNIKNVKAGIKLVSARAGADLEGGSGIGFLLALSSGDELKRLESATAKLSYRLCGQLCSLEGKLKGFEGIRRWRAEWGHLFSLPIPRSRLLQSQSQWW